MKTKITWLALAALMLITAPFQILAQEEEEEEGHFFSVSTYNWPFNKTEEIFEIMAEDKDIVDQNEFILSRKVLSHAWAGNFSVMIILEYASFEDVTKSQARGNELFEAKYPDEADREARGDKLSTLTGSGMHNDDIVQDNPSLTK